ncbi:MAG: PAS domain S-box protein, partial [Peptococcaceae bacterium]|nr:PAS domain S-box protein [Peptococcaceae bacterium]
TYHQELANIKQDINIPPDQKVLAINKILQPSLNSISNRYPQYGLGYYDKELNTIAAIAPNFNPNLLTEIPSDQPYFMSYQSQKPEFFVHNTSLNWSGKAIIGVTVPVSYQGKIIGHTWTNVKKADLVFLLIKHIIKVLALGMIFLGIMMAIIKRSLSQNLKTLNDKDINNTTVTKKQLEIANTFLKILIESQHIGCIVLDNNWQFVYLNKDSSQTIFTKDQLIGKNIWQEYPEAIGSQFQQKLEQVKKQAVPYHWEAQSPFPDKNFYRYSAYPFGKGIAVFYTDITTEKNYRKKLYQLAAIVQSSVDGIMSTTSDGYIKFWNKAAEKIYGYQASEIIGQHISILTPEELLSNDQEILNAINEGKSISKLETTRRTKSGKTVHVSLSISPLYGEDSKIYGASIITHDITNKINIENMLREEIKQRERTEADFKAVFDKSKLGIATKGRDGKIIRCNKAFENIIGYSAEELAHMDWATITHPDDLEKENLLTEELLAGTRDYYELEKRYIHKNGNYIWTRTTIVLSKGYNEVTIAFVEDITEQNSYREQMIKLDRLNLIGEMAAGISHEVRNPMAAVRGFLQILQTKKDLSHYDHYFTTKIEELDRANHIISEFLSIGRNTLTNMKEEDLNSIIESLKPLIEADGYANDHYLQVELSPIPKLLLNNKEIRQMILNLVRNGFEAMPAGGTLTIKTYCRDQKVVLAIKDQGCGIKPEVLEKLGTPFFTTKQNGTGLGLGICYGIATRHNADINIETGPEGTTFYVEFKPLNSNS